MSDSRRPIVPSGQDGATAFPQATTPSRARGLVAPPGVAALIIANVVFATGLFCHAFLYNFYLEGLGHSEVVMGNAAAALTFGGLVSLLPAGGLVDRVTPRIALVCGGAIVSMGLAAGAFTRAPAAIYLAAMLAGAGAGVWRVAVGPALMRLTDDDSRSRAFGWNVGLLIAASGIGLAVAGSAPAMLASLSGTDPLQGIRITLLAGAIVSALSVPLFASLARTARPSPDTSAPADRRADAEQFRRTLPVLGSIAAWMLAAALLAPFLNIFFTRRFALPVATVGFITAAAHLVWGASVFASGGIARRMGVSRLLQATTLAFAPALLALAWTRNLPLAVVLFTLQGMIGPLTNPLIDQLLLARVAASRHGKVSGWRNAAADLSGLAGASLGGLLLARTSFATLIATGGVIGLLGAIGLIRSIRALERVSDPASGVDPHASAAIEGA